MSKQQTAVDFFYDFIKIHCDNDVELYETCVRALEQAKQMEKEQIKTAFQEGKWNGWEWSKGKEKLKDPSEYYDETYSE